MRKLSFILGAAIFAVLLTPAGFAQQADTDQQLGQPSFGVGEDPLGMSAGTPHLGPIEPSLVFYDANVAASGVGLRNKSGAVINTHGIPEGAEIVAAYLYWVYIAPAPIPGVHDFMGFRRLNPRPSIKGKNYVRGTLCGMGPDPCWTQPGTNYNWVFRADVTPYILGNPANPGRCGAYGIVPRHGAQGVNDCSDPWGSPPVAPLLEGASLVIVYREAGMGPHNGNGTVYIYDTEVPPYNLGLCGKTFYGCSGIAYSLDNLFAPQLSHGKFIQIGADGQSGEGFEADLDFAAERTTLQLPNAGFNFIVSGPGSEYYNSDWNGMDGNCLPQLWDTSCHDISPLFSSIGASVTSIDVEIRNYQMVDNDGCNWEPCYAGPSDCLIPVANIVWIKERYPY